MNRDKAKEMLYEINDVGGSGLSLIDKIYDDIESNKCENCNNWNIFKGEFGNCKMKVNIAHLNQMHHSFGCNIFERKK